MCPMGHTLHSFRKRGNNILYRNKDACRQCTNRCTTSKGAKAAQFGHSTTHLAVKMYTEQEKVKNVPPKEHVYHNAFSRETGKAEKVILRIKEDKEKIHTRMCTVEHPFGTIKWYDGAHYVLCKGKEKVGAEIGLSYLAYNLKRAINMMGARELVKAIKG